MNFTYKLSRTEKNARDHYDSPDNVVESIPFLELMPCAWLMDDSLYLYTGNLAMLVAFFMLQLPAEVAQIVV